MKTIESYGGPLIGLSRCDVHHWSGIDGKLFIGDAAPFSTDYDAVGSAMLNKRKLAGYLAKMTGATDEGLLINTPVRTLIVAFDDRSVHLAQIVSAEVGWSESMIKVDYFNQGRKDDDVICVNVKLGGFTFFDSSCPSGWLEEDFLFVDLSPGLYVCESAQWKVQGQANLIMIRMEKHDR